MLTGTMDPGIREYETVHALTARKAAAEGMVLLKNEDDLLPLKKGTKLALFGAGAGHTIKGGTGSGDVNERHSVTIAEGLENAGFDITTTKWLAEYDRIYDSAREAWRDEILNKAGAYSGLAAFEAYATTPFMVPAGPDAVKTDAATAVYVLSRIAGEGADRDLADGDYYISKDEERIISSACSMYENVILLINTGGAVDLGFLDKYSNIKAILYISQPGQEGGTAVSDILLGNVTPSGKLTDSWPYNYSDIPFAQDYSHLNGNIDKDYYKEGIYVGYRYFDTFDVPVRFGFGYGLSYTSFEQNVASVTYENETVTVNVNVKNTGDTYSGKEVIQIYASCPSGALRKEYRRLVGFEKTGLLRPKEECTLDVTFPLQALTSYSEEKAAWILERGVYGIFAGTSLEESTPAASLTVPEETILIKTKNICSLQEPLDEMRDVKNLSEAKREKWLGNIKALPSFTVSDVKCENIIYGDDDATVPEDIKDFVETLSSDELIKLATGDTGKSQNSSNLGSSGIAVPGSAAQTSDCIADKGYGYIVLADGPAGLRLTKKYYVKDGALVPMPLMASLEGGYLMKDAEEIEGDIWYQYCTAFPVGTLLAMSWNREILYEVGKAAGEEMKEFNVTLWLAPGMNIHKNPLCGRNFEYYSEDPFVSGIAAAAITNGVQSIPGCGTTIKHFACNSQEDNRIGVDAVLSERALREIYLKGFELAVKMSRPHSIMTSYNIINGVHAANNHGICTEAARCEWGFDGAIMTDWLTTTHGDDCTASGCMRAGNDMVMPGTEKDHENLKRELESGTLKAEDIKRCVSRVLRAVRQAEE